MVNHPRLRRQVLGGLGLGLVGGLAGCQDLTGGTSPPPMDDRQAPEPSRSEEDVESVEYGDGVISTLQAGDGTDPVFGDVAEPVQFAGEQGDVVEIGMSAESFTPYQLLEAPGGQIVGRDEDTDQTTKSVIWRRLPQTGTYTIWAGSVSGTETGSYTLTLELSDARAAFTQFPSIQLGDSFQREITDAPPVDPVFGDLATPIGVTVDATTIGQLTLKSGDVDPFLVLEEPSGRVGEYDDDGGEGTNSRLETQLQTGQYIAWASTYSGDGVGSFTLETSGG